MPDQAILGAAIYPSGKTWKHVAYLVRSARRHTPRSGIYLITAPLSPSERRLLAGHGVVAFEWASPAPNLGRKSPKASPAFFQWLHRIWIDRHDLYPHALEAIPEAYVLLADTRDVLITGDLAGLCPRTDLVLSQEYAGLTLGTEPVNRKWMLEGYGSVVADRLESAPILCAGTVFGPIKKIKTYVASMRRELDNIGMEKAVSMGDQPVHNYLAHSGQLPECSISTAEDGPIRSIGAMPTALVCTSWLQQSEGSKPLVIHQYDRHVGHPVVRKAVRHLIGLPWWKIIRTA
jgi:hypothetical protein